MRLTLVAFVTSLLVLCPRPSAAQAPDAGQAPVEVRVTLVGRAYTAELEELLKEWFSAQGQQVSVAHQPSVALEHLLKESDVGEVRAWLVLPSEHQARVYFADTGGRRFFVRDVPLVSGLDELGREKLAQVVVASAQAFSERQVEDTPLESVKAALAETPAAEPKPTAPPKPSPPATPPPKPSKMSVSGEPTEPEDGMSALSWALAAGYVAVYRGPEGLSHGPSLSLEGWFVGDHLALGLAGGGRYELPHRVAGPDLDLDLHTTQLRLALFTGSSSEGRPNWVLGAGLGSDWFAFRPSHPSGGVALRKGDRARRSLVVVSFGRFVSFAALRLSALAGVDISLAKSHYDIRVAGQPRRELTPWQVHPNLSLELGWH